MKSCFSIKKLEEVLKLDPNNKFGYSDQAKQEINKIKSAHKNLEIKCN